VASSAGIRDTTGVGYLVNLTLKGRPAVVIGGGPVGARKAEALLAAGARVTVIAPKACARIRALASKGSIVGRWRRYRAADLNGAFLAIAATDDESLNARIARDAQARNILVNVVDHPRLCTFSVPATARRGSLTFAVATDGLCPSLAGLLREEILARYGPEYAELAKLFGKLRAQMLALGWGSRRIKNTLSEMYRGGIAGVISAGDRRALEEFLRIRLGSGFPLPFR
jgi:precorrin-2 dehydrogenase/sirohydrochlorin ferrochelatase